MRLISFLVSLHGFLFIYNSITKFYENEIFKYGKLNLGFKYYNLGVILGILLLFSGLGIFIKWKAGYYSSMVSYLFLSVYGVVSLVYLNVVNGVEIIPSIIVFVEVIIFYSLFRYIRRNKGWFDNI